MDNEMPYLLPTKEKRQYPQNMDQLHDTQTINKYSNMQNFYNNNYWGYGVFGNQTNHNPIQDQDRIQSDYDYSVSTVRNFGDQIALTGAAEGIKYATTLRKIGEGAEATVYSRPISRVVHKKSTIPRSELHMRNQIPGTAKVKYTGTENGFSTFTQPKIRILTQDQIQKMAGKIEKFMNSHGWRKVTHKNLQGLGFTNGRFVISDLNEGNVGVTLTGKPRFIDLVVETVPDFRIAIQRKGGKVMY